MSYRFLTQPFRASTLVVLCLVVAGCASAPQNADKVAVVDGRNSFTSKCELLGSVSDSVNGWKFSDVQEARTQVIWNMQAKAYNFYVADTLSVDSIGNNLTSVFGTGTAMKCFK